MIISLLQGRTGNNLFQYAAGRALADRLKTDLILEGSWADPELERQFRAILRFPLRATYRRRFSIPKRILHRYLNRGPEFWHSGKIHRETGAGADPELERLSDGTLLFGYFQSPHNFESSTEAIRRDLNPDAIDLEEAGKGLLEQIRPATTVSLHVRRGDYLRIASTDCLGGDYHDRAVAWFRGEYPGCRFCVFSDDIPWCRQRFAGPDFFFCDLPGSARDPLQDMILMSKCHHHIIVNSSYSWWGAWLNPSTDKRVVAPGEWMKGMESGQVVPRDWVRI